jgi:hypothetical protein
LWATTIGRSGAAGAGSPAGSSHGCAAASVPDGEAAASDGSTAAPAGDRDGAGQADAAIDKSATTTLRRRIVPSMPRRGRERVSAGAAARLTGP